MARMINGIEVETVGELKAALASVADEMPVSDAVGEPLCLRIFEHEGEKFMEVA